MESGGYSTFRGNASLETYKVTILNGEVFSEPINLKAGVLVGIQVPNGFIGGSVLLENSFDEGQNFFSVVKPNLDDFIIEVAQDELVNLSSLGFNCLSIIRLVTSTQDDDRNVILVIRH